MERKFLVIIGLVMVASLSAAGCTVTNTNSNSSQNQVQFPSSGPGTSDSASKAITENYASNGYEIVKPFVKATNQYGNVVYTGVVNDANATHLTPYQHNVTIELMKNKTETKQRVSQLALLETSPVTKAISTQEDSTALLHPKYCLPAQCFAYVGDANRPTTWKLPYLLEDGNIDVKRLPKAIQAILSNYRGARVSSVPEKAIPDVLRRLAAAAEQLGRMPHQGETAEVYEMLAQALKQVERF